MQKKLTPANIYHLNKVHVKRNPPGHVFVKQQHGVGPAQIPQPRVYAPLEHDVHRGVQHLLVPCPDELGTVHLTRQHAVSVGQAGHNVPISLFDL